MYQELAIWALYAFAAIVVVVQSLNRVQLFVTLWTVAHQAPLSMGFSRQEYFSGLPCPPPGDLPDPGIEPASVASPALAGRFFTTEPPGKLTCIQMPLSYPILHNKSFALSSGLKKFGLAPLVVFFFLFFFLRYKFFFEIRSDRRKRRGKAGRKQ